MSLGSINTKIQEYDYNKVSFVTDNSRQECSSLYTWLAGESDQQRSMSVNAYTHDSSTLQSISCYMKSLQDIYIENDSSILPDPHKTTMYTSISMVYTTISNSDNQNDVVKCKNSTHKVFTPVVLTEKVLYITRLVYFREVILVILIAILTTIVFKNHQQKHGRLNP